MDEFKPIKVNITKNMLVEVGKHCGMWYFEGRKATSESLFRGAVAERICCSDKVTSQHYPLVTYRHYDFEYFDVYFDVKSQKLKYNEISPKMHVHIEDAQKDAQKCDAYIFCFVNLDECLAIIPGIITKENYFKHAERKVFEQPTSKGKTITRVQWSLELKHLDFISSLDDFLEKASGYSKVLGRYDSWEVNQKNNIKSENQIRIKTLKEKNILDCFTQKYDMLKVNEE